MAVLSAIATFILVWQLFGGSHRKDAQINLPCLSKTTPQLKPAVWNSLWIDGTHNRNATNIGWLFTIPRRHYDPEYRHVLLNRKWKAAAEAAATQQKKKGEKAGRDFDGLREKRASSIVTYFCIFVLVLSLIRAALDMNSNLKKVRPLDDSVLLIPCLFLPPVLFLLPLFAWFAFVSVSFQLPGNNSSITSTTTTTAATASNTTSTTAAVTVASTVISSS